MATMASGTTDSLLKTQIESAQTVVPLQITDPRPSRRISAAAGSGILQSRFHAVFYYAGKASGEDSDSDSGWTLAGWTKESLGRALVEQPMLGGRLRRGEEEESDDGSGLELVSNDCGIRLFEARISKTVAEFLDLAEREVAEAELVYWKDIDEENPQFSPLFFLQVTNFLCGGYSVGISSSLVLADPLAIISFLRKWSNIHSRIVSESEQTNPPIFYLPNFKTTASSLDQSGSNQVKDRQKPLIFKTGNTSHSEVETRKALALRCIKEAELKLGGKRASKFTLLVKTPSGEIEVESHSREGPKEEEPFSFEGGLSCGSWDDFGASEVKFWEGNKPACVSYWITCAPGEALVYLVPSPDESVSETLSFVTIP